MKLNLHIMLHFNLMVQNINRLMVNNLILAINDFTIDD